MSRWPCAASAAWRCLAWHCLAGQRLRSVLHRLAWSSLGQCRLGIARQRLARRRPARRRLSWRCLGAARQRCAGNRLMSPCLASPRLCAVSPGTALSGVASRCLASPRLRVALRGPAWYRLARHRPARCCMTCAASPHSTSGRRALPCFDCLRWHPGHGTPSFSVGSLSVGPAAHDSWPRLAPARLASPCSGSALRHRLGFRQHRPAWLRPRLAGFAWRLLSLARHRRLDTGSLGVALLGIALVLRGVAFLFRSLPGTALLNVALTFHSGGRVTLARPRIRAASPRHRAAAFRSTSACLASL